MKNMTNSVCMEQGLSIFKCFGFQCRRQCGKSTVFASGPKFLDFSMSFSNYDCNPLTKWIASFSPALLHILTFREVLVAGFDPRRDRHLQLHPFFEQPRVFLLLLASFLCPGNMMDNQPETFEPIVYVLSEFLGLSITKLHQSVESKWGRSEDVV